MIANGFSRRLAIVNDIVQSLPSCFVQVDKRKFVGADHRDLNRFIGHSLLVVHCSSLVVPMGTTEQSKF